MSPDRGDTSSSVAHGANCVAPAGARSSSLRRPTACAVGSGSFAPSALFGNGACPAPVSLAVLIPVSGPCLSRRVPHGAMRFVAGSVPRAIGRGTDPRQRTLPITTCPAWRHAFRGRISTASDSERVAPQRDIAMFVVYSTSENA